MRCTLLSLVKVAVLWCLPVTVGQINSVPGTSQTSFYLDTTRDCNDHRAREIGQSTVSIYGVSSDYQGTPVTSCSLTLSTENYREPYKLKLQYLSVQINDPGVNFFVYDGEAGGRLKWGWNANNKKPSNLDFDFTTGSQVTFKLTRGELDRSYDIRVIVTPVPSETVDCNYENEYNCGEYGHSYRILGTKEIAGIVAGCFGLVLLIVIIVVCCCYCRTRGITRKWAEEKLGHVNTAASLHTLNGHVPKSNGPNSTKAWTTAESTRSGFASIRRSPNLPRAKIAKSSRLGDGDSMFDSNASLPMKRPLPPPQVNRNPRGASERSYGRRKRDDYSDDDYSDRSFSTATKNFSEKNYKPPTYREAIRHDSESSADEHTFVQADDSRQQSVFIERVIEPRVKKKTADSSSSPNLPRAPPPPVDDETYDSIDPKKTKRSKKIDKEPESSEEETDQSDEDNEETDQSEEETDSEEESEAESEKSDKQDKADAVYSKPDKSKGKSKPDNQNVPQPQQVGFRPPNVQPQQFPQGSYPGGFVPPGVHQPQARYGYPGQPQAGPFPQGQPYYPQGQGQPYPPQGQPFPQGQQYPQSQVYPQGQPQHRPTNPHQTQPNAYHHANFTVPLQTQQAPPISQNPAPQHQPSRHQSHRPTQDSKYNKPQPNVPPVYSHLVNRGYQPVEGRHSPASTSTGASNYSGDRNLQNDDSDFSANLGSGVELMKRNK